MMRELFAEPEEPELAEGMMGQPGDPRMMGRPGDPMMGRPGDPMMGRPGDPMRGRGVPTGGGMPQMAPMPPAGNLIR